MSYQQCMELAGANIDLFENFGSYQGEWWAKVEYNGKVGWVNGDFGSCSGCDAFEAEFGFTSHYVNKEYHSSYDFKDGCEQCEEIKRRMIEFGKEYLDNILTQEEAEKHASRYIEWDMEAQVMLDFLKENAIYVN